jgi:DUF4097 and DUF4098 domain-containing protein YvlB
MRKLHRLEPILLLVLIGGCFSSNSSNPKHQASLEHRYGLPHVAGSAIDVATENGYIFIVVKPAEDKVTIEAIITAVADSDDEAEERAKNITITATRRRRDRSLVVAPAYPEGRRDSEACSFRITLPAVKGVYAQTANGAIHVFSADGIVKVKSSNGSITLQDVTGEADVETGNGSIHFSPAKGSQARFHLRSANGIINVQLLETMHGCIDASTSNGTVGLYGRRKPESVSGAQASKIITLAGSGSTSKIHTDKGDVFITLH